MGRRPPFRLDLCYPGSVALNGNGRGGRTDEGRNRRGGGGGLRGGIKNSDEKSGRAHFSATANISISNPSPYSSPSPSPCLFASPSPCLFASPSSVRLPLRVDGGFAVLGECEDLVRDFPLIHAWRAHGHAWDSEAGDRGFFLQNSQDQVGGHVAFDDVAAGDRCVAGLELRADAVLLLVGCDVIDIVDFRLEAVRLDVFHPRGAAPAARALVDDDGRRGEAAQRGQRAGCNKSGTAGEGRAQKNSAVHLYRSGFRYAREDNTDHPQAGKSTTPARRLASSPGA